MNPSVDALAGTVFKGVEIDARSTELPKPGDRLGRFVLQLELGRGGMGVVYLAQQLEPVERLVALKLMRAKLTSDGALGYFLAERQALAQMRHPAIAQIHEAGTLSDGRPYLSMEYIEGVPFDEYVVRKQLPLKGRLKLFIELCRGVQHAHNKGVIHRDIKPNNVLITEFDGRPSPKLIDFGIALANKASIGAPDARASTDRVGTGAYMSPEQAGAHDLNLDGRSDVYALGVLLGDIVAAGAPLPGAFPQVAAPPTLAGNEPTLERKTAGNAPVAVAGVADELALVITCATRFYRDDRYDSALELAEDVERFLANRPLKAGPDSPSYRAKKFLQRHTKALLVGALLTLTLFIGSALAVAGLLKARAEQARTEIALAKTQALSNFLSGMLGSVDPDVAGALDKTLLKMVLDEAAHRADQEFLNSPEINADLQLTIGKTYVALGEFERGIEHLNRAETLNRGSNDAAALLAIRRAKFEYASSISDVGAAKQLLVEMRRDAISNPLRLLDELGLDLSEGQLLWRDGDYVGSLKILESLRARAKREVGPEAHITWRSELSIGAVRVEKGEFGLAEAGLKDLLKRVKVSGTSGEAMEIDVSNSLAVAQMEQKRYAQAALVLKAALERAEKIYGKESPRLIMLVSNLAGALRQSGDLLGSGPFYLRAAEKTRSSYGEDSLYSAVAQSNLGNFWRESGDLKAAEDAYQTAQRFILAGNALRHPFAAMINADFTEFLLVQKRFAEAKQLAQRSHGVLLEKFGADNERTRRAAALLARAEAGESR